MSIFTKQKDAAYLARLDTPGVFDNTTKTALPQTFVAKIIEKHFAAAKEKTPKALIMGFDGARADCMHLLVPSENEKVTGRLFASAYSAVNALKAEGGLFLSYAGGDPDCLQETTTAPGWAAILTGVWGKESGIWEHVTLHTDCPTVLRRLAESGKKAAFLAEWPDHFKVTYKAEIEMAKTQGLPLTFTQYADDAALAEAFSQHIAGDTDCIFGIFEAPDANGHATGFSLENPFFTAGTMRLDNVAYRLMEEVRARPTYSDEDWLVLITSDHGGHQRRHGTQMQYDRMTFIAVNKTI